MALQDNFNYTLNKQKRQKELEKEEKQRQKDAELLKKELVKNLKSDIKAMLVFQFEKEKNTYKNYEFLESKKLKYDIYDKVLKRYSLQSYKLDFNISRYLDNIYEKTFKELLQKEKLIKKLKEDDEDQNTKSLKINNILNVEQQIDIARALPTCRKSNKKIFKNAGVGFFGTLGIILHEISKMGDD